MFDAEIVGQLVSGSFAEILVRQKHGQRIEIGGLFVSGKSEDYYILECFDLLYGSQIGDLTKQLISGMNLEGYDDLQFYDDELSNYSLARMRAVLHVKDGKYSAPKSLPPSFSGIVPISEEHLQFLGSTSGLLVGNIRSGTKVLHFPATIDIKALTHHILVAATTGRGKSNLVKVIVASLIDNENVGMLILDPHDEYYGRNSNAGAIHSRGFNNSKNCIYYSLNPPAGARKLVINVKTLNPSSIEMNLTEAQEQAISYYYNRHGSRWIEELMCSEIDPNDKAVREATVYTLRRKFEVILGITSHDGDLIADGVFSTTAGMTTVSDICNELENGKKIIIDTSLMSGDLEIIVGSMIAREMLQRYKKYKMDGLLENKPLISIVVEEAPRVLNNEALQKGNVFSTIAREGRKFQIGLIAITQLPSLIPREILANMNTKIILGTELGSERNALIESASQDLSRSDRAIASLDKGEAKDKSNFTKCALPVKVPEFKGLADDNERKDAFGVSTRKGFVGL